MKYDPSILCTQYPDGPRHIDSQIEETNLRDIVVPFLGSQMSQSYAGIYFLENYIQAHQFQYVVEFGSHAGAVSLYLANCAAVGKKFYFGGFVFDFIE